MNKNGLKKVKNAIIETTGTVLADFALGMCQPIFSVIPKYSKIRNSEVIFFFVVTIFHNNNFRRIKKLSEFYPRIYLLCVKPAVVAERFRACVKFK